jgi:hypothetical protein
MKNLRLKLSLLTLAYLPLLIEGLRWCMGRMWGDA